MSHPASRAGRALALALAATLLSAGCGARWAYRQGQSEAKKGNWDMAVARLTKALQDDPDNITYKLALENARVQASRQHYTEARKHMAADELELAAEELDIAVKYDGANKSAADDLANVRLKIQKREDEKQRMADFPAMNSRAQAQRLPIPVLSPRSTAPIHMNFADQSLQTILEALGKVAGVNVLFDADYRDKKAKVNLQGVTFQEALDQITFAHRLFYKVIDKNTIIIVQDSQAKRRVYEDLLLRTFYLQNVDTKEVEAILKTALGPQAKVLGNPTVNALTIIGTVDQLALAARVIGANDKAKGEVMVEVRIMEVNRNKLKQYGIRLANYTAGVQLAPIAPPLDGNNPQLNIRAHLLSSLNLSDFVVNIPAAIFVNFLQTEDSVKILASPRLRAAEGKKTALKIGTEVPIPITTFTATQPIPGGGGGFSPATSFQYRNVGVNLELTPKVSASGEITLEMGAEFSLPGNESEIGGQTLPTFFTRTVNGILRVRDGETTLVGGLLQTREIETLSGVIGLSSIPVINKIFPSTSRRYEQQEILVSITPHLVRAPKIVEEDLQTVLIGTQDLVRVEGARPPLFGEPEEVAPPTPAPPAVPPGPSAGRPPATVSPGQPPAGEQPTPAVTPVPPQALPTPLPALEPTPEPPASPTPPPGGGGVSSAAFTPAETSVRVGETTMVSLVIMNAQNITGVELLIAFDPAIVEGVDVSAGSLLTLDGAAVGSERNLEPGRVRARLTRPAPTSGSGVVAHLTFRGLGPGTTPLNVEVIALATASGGTSAPALAGPARVTVVAGAPQ